MFRLGSTFNSHTGGRNFVEGPSTCIGNILLLNFGRFDASRFVDNTCAFWYMSLGYIWCIFSTTVLALHVMVIVALWWRGEVHNIASFGLNGFQFSHFLHRLL